ncbi:MAG: hypothetical protein WCH39_22020 [Schlesneria sp.]
MIDALRGGEYLPVKIGISNFEGDGISQTGKQCYEKYGCLKLSDVPRHLFLPANIIRKLQIRPLSSAD